MEREAIQRGFAAWLRDPGRAALPPGADPVRLDVYAELSFNNIESLLAANFPVIRHLHATQDWHELVRRFYREHTCRTPLFTRLAGEFVAYLAARRTRGEPDPAFLAELAHHEWAELDLALDTAEQDDVPHDPAGDPVAGVPAVSPLVRLNAYRHPVHRIDAEALRNGVAATPVILLLVRDATDRVRFHELSPLAGLLFERLQANAHRSGHDCVRDLLGELDAKPDLLADGLVLLQRWQACEAVLGTRRAVPAGP